MMNVRRDQAFLFLNRCFINTELVIVKQKHNHSKLLRKGSSFLPIVLQKERMDCNFDIDDKTEYHHSFETSIDQQRKQLLILLKSSQKQQQLSFAKTFLFGRDGPGHIGEFLEKARFMKSEISLQQFQQNKLSKDFPPTSNIFSFSK
jgi:hypothetical protein